MDYKVKYEQAIADARAIIKDYKERHLDNIAKRSEEDFSAVFPELKESEDERIRKKLIEAVKGDMVVGGTKDKQLAIAWLEKQGEQKHQYKSRPRYVGEEELLGAIEFGAKWKEEQFEKNRLKHCNSITNEQAELEQEFVDQHLDKHQRMPTFLDAIEYGMRLQKEQMMAKAIDADCFGFQGAALFSFRLPSDKYLVGSKVKVIVIKED